MSYLVLARRFRPQTFDDIVGQDHVTRTLKNAIESGRVAHAFLFSGARGVGKTTAARVLAKALNCVEGPTATPCGVCEQCLGIAESRSVDVQEIDGASNNSVDDIRALRETVPYQPSSARFKIYIVDEVHMLTQSAFNALLKTLEEPPPHVKFVFATTEPHKIPVTILSRCQRYDFRLVPTALIFKRLESILGEEGVPAEPAALSLLAREAQGSMRDALSLLDRALAYDSARLEAQAMTRLLGVADRPLLFQLVTAVLSHDAAGALHAVDRAATFGCDLTRFSHDVLRHLRDLVIAAQCPDDADLLEVSEDERQELLAQAAGHDVAELHRLFLLFSKATEEIARSSQARLLLEMVLARLATLEPMRSLEELARRLDQLAAAGPTPAGVGSRTAGRGQPPRQPPREQPPRSRPAEGPARSRPAPGGGPESQARPADRPGAESGATPVAPAPPPDADAEPGGGADAAALWRRLLAHVESSSPPLFHLLQHAEPVELSAAAVRLRLPDQPFFRAEAKSPQRLQALEAAFRAFFQTDVTVRLEIAEGGGAKPPERGHIEHAAREHDRRREAMEHSMVRAALNEFDGARIETIKLFDEDDT
jgi:DNA polymerase-3 subunit gamma/tau